MDNTHKAQLIVSLENAKAEVKMHRGLLHKAESAVCKIESELTDSFTPGKSNYSVGELAAARRDILSVISDQWIPPREIVDRLADHSSALVMREVHKLAGNPRSDVMWNNRKGPASMYRRFRSVILDCVS